MKTVIKEVCQHCGQSIMQHKHGLSRSLCDILMIIAQKHTAGVAFHPVRDVNLDKFQYTNFQKLRYFGLIVKVKDDEKRAAGFWALTGLAAAFLRGKAIPKWKKTFNNRVVEASEELIRLEEVIGSFELPEQWAEKAEPVKKLVEELPLFDKASSH